MKSEAKMAAHGWQFCMSVSVPYADLYVSFSLSCDFLFFLKIFPIENTHKTCLQKTGMSLRISNIFRQNQTELQVIYFHENKLPNWRETWRDYQSDVKNFPPWAAILASLFARANDWELAFQIWKLSSLPLSWPTCKPPYWPQNTIYRYSSSRLWVQWAYHCGKPPGIFHNVVSSHHPQ